MPRNTIHVNVALLGFGNVGQALARLMQRKALTLREQYGLSFAITGIATRSRGIALDEHGLDITRALEAAESGSLEALHAGTSISDPLAFVRSVPAELIVETTPLSVADGQPALDYLRAALQSGRHVVTANKGPVAFGYRELNDLARAHDRGFFFESTVMGGAPTLDLARECLLASDFMRIRGILNSTTNSILTRMAQGMDFDQAVTEMQQAGLAETDPSNDIDGWDASVKLVILANVLMGADLRISDVDRTGIRGVTADQLQEATQRGQTIRLLCEAVRDGETVRAFVRPTALAVDDPLSQIVGPTNSILFETDSLHLGVTEHRGSPTSTAYGVLVDMINIARGRYRA